ncbi:pqq-like domain containing protein [Plakobranchus ocellatus]|uniref:Pqq-like domain containing protein n=1 Tax=Plakobranchus ocellatus TaxID=259542 RepID=A0AAV4A7X9_9GAST|nr:pqq-like domain containing protein [Plakobranchus ocellatus]
MGEQETNSQTGRNGADGYGVKDIVCDIYFEGQTPCFGGVLALEGATGRELWRRYAQHEVYGLNCQYDLDKDGVKDCLAAGRAGTFFAVSCKEGKLLWSLGESEARNAVMNFYTPQYISDLDGDGIADIVTVHGGDPLQEAGSPQRLSGRILVVSGKTGHVLRWTGVPDNQESYYSPQLTSHLGQVPVLLFGTGGETHNGSLWEIELNSLLEGSMDRAVKLSSDTHKGFMTPPALVDINGDGIEDILVPIFNSTLLALDGSDTGGTKSGTGPKPLWTSKFPGSETYSTPAVGFYNEDDVPDVMVKFAHGPGYPVYYYSETTVLDGRTGKRLIHPPLRDTIGSQASPLTVAMEGQGNDVFLTWMADCVDHEGDTSWFDFVGGTQDREKSRADLCRLRYKTDGISKMVAVGRNLPSGGIPIYQSEKRRAVEHSKWVNTSLEGIEYLMKHPELYEDLSNTDSDTVLAPEDGQISEDYSGGVREPYRVPTYPSSHSIGSKKGPSYQRTNDRLMGYPRQDGATGTSATSGYGNGNTARNSNGRYRSKGSYYSSGAQLLPADDIYRVPSPSYQRSRNRGGSRGSYYGTQYESVYPGNSNIDNGIYNPQGYPYKYSRNASPRKRGTVRDKEEARGGKGTFSSERENKVFKKRKNEVIPTRIMRNWKKRSVRRHRHVGPHDDGGIQRLLSTGHLAPTSLPDTHPDHNSTIDLVFATYWFFPQRTQAILPEDRKCIAEKLALEKDFGFHINSPNHQMDRNKYEERITQLCLQKSDSKVPDNRVYSNSDDEYNPFSVNMGQMTIYRVRLKFSCTQPINATETNTRCASVLPFAKQKWAGYMGSNGDSHWTVPHL